MNVIELKNIKHSGFASQETHCYEASVYFNGKRVGVVSNDGHGGADRQDATDKDGWAQMESYIDALNAPQNPVRKAQIVRDRIRKLVKIGDDAYSENDAQFSDEEILADERLMAVLDITYMKDDLESISCEQINDFLVRKDMKRLLSKKVLYVKDGAIYNTKQAKNKAVLAGWIEQVAEWDGVTEVLNTMPEAAALKLFKEQCG